ncbi:hypothetical protein BT63DRAFT_422708 [Microthyrium microscopicum]|uniref:Vacuolar membrane-associated protein IML1 n=1 Tax=Microthyrium microscopicum TaxID=703497 RepID=A0A6A6UL19_9PEZI|nr:hypothetical protein BT63DRAFT_422708 [Microthyrium microscopicum]
MALPTRDTAPNPLRRFGTVQKLCSLRTHDANTFKDDIIFDLNKFPELSAHPGDLIHIVALAESSSSLDASNSNRKSGRDARHQPSGSESSRPSTRPSAGRTTTGVTTYDEQGRVVSPTKVRDKARSYVFVARELSADERAKLQGACLSVSATVAGTFGFKIWTQVLVSVVEEEEYAASHVEITFRDQYLSRADMWRLAIAELSQKTVYREQKLLFLDTIRATVKTIYRNGEKQKSGYFGSNTKPIFRSESARYIIFIEMSKEMWEFDVEGGGEIMFNKVINGFLPELFKNWSAVHAKHLISIVMFSRVEYEESDPRHVSTLDTEDQDPRAGSRDFYRVVVSDVSSNDWISILNQLKREFLHFLRDITIQQSAAAEQSASFPFGKRDSEPEFVIVGKPSTAAKGNILEAINLASSQFSRDYIDRDLVRTGISVVVITAGSGIYEVDYSLLKLTTETLVGSGIGIDLVCLAPMPLHSVPLFKYRNPRTTGKASSILHTNPNSLDNTPRQSDMLLRTTSVPDSEPTPGDWSFAIPHWIDVSFWKGATDDASLSLVAKGPRRKKSQDSRAVARPFHLRCVLYELEMMGFMENEMSNIAISLLHEHPLHPWHKLRHRIVGRPPNEIDKSGVESLERGWMEDYDEDVFRPVDSRLANEAAARKFFRANAADRMNMTKEPTIPSEGTLELEKRSRPGAAFSEREMSQGPPSNTARRKQSMSSVMSNTDRASIMSKTTSLLSRQISYSTATLAAPQGTFDTTMVSPVSATFATTSSEDKPKQSATRYLDRFKAALARSAVPKETVKEKAEGDINDVEEDIPKKAIDGPSKPIDIGPSRINHHSRSSSNDDKIGSTGTVKAKNIYTKKGSLPRREDGAILAISAIASSARRQVLKPPAGLSTSGEGLRIPPTISPFRGIAPWLVLVNPSNPKKNNFNVNNQFRRWKHVFPKQLKVSSMKWKSLSSPASVPLTNDFFPSAQQLAEEFQESTYNIAQNTEEDTEEQMGREVLVRELIAFRLAHGFQLIVGTAVAEFLGRHGPELGDIFDKNYMARDGSTVFMSMGNTIHQLLCLTGGEVEIRRFRRKPTAEIETPEGRNVMSYKPWIRTSLSADYQPREISLKKPSTEYNWNYIDTFIAGYHDEFSDNLRFWRARFVFIPVDVPAQTRREFPQFSEEEAQIEGIRKMTQIWQRNRVLPLDENTFQSMRRRKDPNPLRIEHQTKDPSVFVATGGMNLPEGDQQSSLIFPDIEKYSTNNVDLPKLAQDLQGEHGVPMKDRWWHLKLYHYSFTGSDLANWLVDRFSDVETIDDAEDLGNELMEKGLFQHVSKRHKFQEGVYYYTLTPEYRNRAEPKGWFTSRTRGSVPPTPSADGSKTPFTPNSTLSSRPTTSSSEASSSNEKAANEKINITTTNPTPTIKDAPRRKMVLGQSMRYNVDPKKHSYRPELVTLHYDRLHSPDNCYHFRLDWMNVTPKLIDDAIASWATHGRRYGLRLVELPIAEASAIPATHPFRAPYPIQLPLRNLPLSSASPTTHLSLAAQHPASFAASHAHDPLAFHKAVLRKHGFVLDVEAASSFPADVEVKYSWGAPSYEHTQYIHRSGSTLAQITQAGTFLLLSNRLFSDRGPLLTSMPHKDLVELRARSRAGVSPAGSPALRPVADPDTKDGDGKEGGGKGVEVKSAEEICKELETFCTNDGAVRALYEELMRPVPSPSPAPGPVSGALMGLDAVPSLRLPSRVVRELALEGKERL